jgi:lipopolysaccharide transport system ATP-binding protein
MSATRRAPAEASLSVPAVPSTGRAAAASSDLAISAEGLSKKYRLGARRTGYRTLREALSGAVARPFERLRRAGSGSPADAERTVWALDGVSFEVRRGDVVGVIGRNGAGKSTLLKVLSRITEPTAGRAWIHGRVGSLLEVGTGFHPELTGRENIFLNGAILGMRRVEITAKFDEIVAFAEIARFIDTPVKHYSSGMYLRLAFAVAAHLEPEILLVDEVLAVGDVLFQKKCLGKMEDVARTGRTVLFVSHNMGAVRSLCNTGLVLDSGKLTAAGDIGDCVEAYFKMIGAFGADVSPSPPTASGALRTGFGRVLVGRAGENSAAQDEPLELATTLSVAEPVGGFSLFCIVEDMQNRMVFHLREESPTLGLPSAPTGRYAIRVRLPPLWLNTGLYSLHFKALLWGDGAGRTVSDKVPLDVTGSHSKADAILHPSAEWRVALEGESRSS